MAANVWQLAAWRCQVLLLSWAAIHSMYTHLLSAQGNKCCVVSTHSGIHLTACVITVSKVAATHMYDVTVATTAQPTYWVHICILEALTNALKQAAAMDLTVWNTRLTIVLASSTSLASCTSCHR